MSCTSTDDHFLVYVHLGCLHILVTVPSPVINIGVYLSFQINDFVFGDRCQEMVVLVHMLIFG